jgi:hypothetical protein
VYKRSEDVKMDLRGEPSHICICGSRLWNLQAMFEDYEVSFYLLEMECADCGSLATAPTLVDSPGYRKELE